MLLILAEAIFFFCGFVEFFPAGFSCRRLGSKKVPWKILMLNYDIAHEAWHGTQGPDTPISSPDPLELQASISRLVRFISASSFLAPVSISCFVMI